MSRYANGRLHMRGPGGRFRQARAEDIGIGGVCPTCHHFLLRHYDGDPRDQHPDPRRFVYRCFTCSPLTQAEQELQAEIEASKPKSPGILDILREADRAEGKDG